MNRLILFISAFFLSVGASATHLVGGELYYTCLGSNNYEITLKVYRDCGASNTNGTPFDPNAAIGIYFGNGTLKQVVNVAFPGATNIPVVINNPCLVVPPNICVQEAVYKTTINLPPNPAGYDIVYQRCCRNPTILNIVNPGNYGNTYHSHIPANDNCNSSPRFKQFPPIALCMGDALNFDHSATDPDGDSLVYSFCRPFHGGNPGAPAPNPPSAPAFTNIVWAAGYSDAYQMDASPAMAVNSSTGLMTGTPNRLGQFVVGVRVEEYRNGVLLGETRRDFQFNVANCNMTILAAVANQTVFCDGLTVSFQNNSQNSSFYFWDFGDSQNPNDTSTQVSPTFTYSDSGTYTVMLIANPGWPCADTSFNTFTVYPKLKAHFNAPAIQCFNGNSFDFFAGGNFEPSTQFNWDFGSYATPISSTQQNPQNIQFTQTGRHVVKLTYTDFTCVKEYTDTVEVIANPELDFQLGTTEGCPILAVQFYDSSTSQTPLTYLWSFGDGTYSSQAAPLHHYNEPGFYDVSVTIMTTSGCIDTLSLYLQNAIHVYPVPTAGFSFTPDEVWEWEPYITFFDESKDNISCELFPGDGTKYSICATIEHTYQDTGWVYPMQVVVNDYGCTDTLVKKVFVRPEFTFYPPNTFTPDGDGLNDVWWPRVYAAKEYELYVFDRWGHIVFETTSTEVGWNGIVKGGSEIAPTGVYQYLAKCWDRNGREYHYVGNVHLLK